MRITSKSLHHSNIVFVFDESRFIAPENHVLASFYRGEAAIGARFVDDPVLRTKILELPKLKLQISVEPVRLKIDDNSQEEPEKSFLIKEAVNVFQQLFSQNSKLIGFGFNFDIYYQTNQVIRLQDFFAGFAGKEALKKSELMDFGVQFTLEKDGGKKREIYFIKITAPLEIAVHVNYHFPSLKLAPPLRLPELSEIETSFSKCYNETDEIIEGLKF